MAQPPRVKLTVRRLILGRELRELREARGLTAQQAGSAVGYSHTQILRVEDGLIGLRDPVLEGLLRLYGVDDADTLKEYVRRSREAGNDDGWWDQHTVPPKFDTYVILESVARKISTFELAVVPGLMQTEEYARAVSGITNAEVKLRLGRQKQLTRAEPPPPQLIAVIDETVLRRVVGSPEVMRDQLRHITLLTEQIGAVVHVLPADVGYHRGLLGPFTLLEFDELATLGYAEAITGNLYVEKSHQVHDLVDRYGELRGMALSPTDSVALIHQIAEEI